MPRSRLALLHLRLPSRVPPVGSLVHFLASVLFLALASVVLLLALALVAPLASLVSVMLLDFVAVVEAIRVIFKAVLRAAAMAGLEIMATAVTDRETDIMASMSPAAAALLMPMTAATTPTATGNTGASRFAPENE